MNYIRENPLEYKALAEFVSGLNVSLPKNVDVTTLNFLGLKEVAQTEEPLVSPGYVCTEVFPEKRGDRWIQRWEVRKVEPTDTDLQIAKEVKKNVITATRYEVEMGGVRIDGMVIATDGASQAKLNAALGVLERGFIKTVDWKCVNGWKKLDLEGVRRVAKIVAEHVQTCFGLERYHHEAIAALNTVEAVSAYETQVGWPCLQD